MTAVLDRPRPAAAPAPRPTPRRLPHRLVLTLIALASSVFWLSEAAHAIAAPSRVEVHYSSSYAEVRWTAVSDATTYYVEVSKDGYYGPWRQWSVSSATTRIRISFADHPYRGSSGAYRYKVTASNSSGYASRSVALNKSQGYGVSTADREKAASKANGCLKQGLAAGATTAAGSGVYAVAAAWIPGVNAVSASAVAAATASTAASTYVVCLLPW